MRPQVESTAAVTTDAWRALNDDTELRFVCGLREADESTRTLAFRSECGTASPVVVAQTAVLRHKAGRRCLIAFDVHADGLPARWLGRCGRAARIFVPRESTACFGTLAPGAFPNRLAWWIQRA